MFVGWAACARSLKCIIDFNGAHESIRDLAFAFAMQIIIVVEIKFQQNFNWSNGCYVEYRGPTSYSYVSECSDYTMME